MDTFAQRRYLCVLVALLRVLLNLVYPVEVSNNCTNEQDKNDHQSLHSSSSKEPEIKERPVRTSAKHAREKVKQVLSQ